MEEDDEFGDLYTDVFQSISSAPAQQPPPQLTPAPQPQASQSTPPLPSRPIDLNLKIPEDERIISSPSDTRTLAPSTALIQGADAVSRASSLRVLDPSVNAESPKPSFPDAKLRINLGAEAVQETKGVYLMETDVKFDIEEADAAPDNGPLTGLTGSRQSNGEDDWDSDSEDELQIVLNENPPLGPMGMFGDGGDDDGDRNEDPLADGVLNQATEATEWTEDAGQTGPDGDRKEPGGTEAMKTSGGTATVAPKVGYSSHGYHPFHSQFKYVRPGAPPMPGSNATGPGGVSGQVRPPINMGTVAGRGRGEWRPSGIRPGGTFQKSYQAGFGPSAWGSGRGFGGGLDFTLPSHKTIFEVDIDSFEEKPWKYPGLDMTDFFNFGLNEESWKDYSKQLGQHRLQTTMQSRIRVHEGARTEQEYDPDMPPELAAATGNHDVPAENANVGKADSGQIDPKAPPLRTPVPSGRPIPVEIGSGERLPYMETRPPRFRDSDAVEIVLQGSLDNDSSTIQGDEDLHDNEPPSTTDDHKADKEFVHEDNKNFDTSREMYSDKKKEPVRRAIKMSTPDRVTNRDEVSPLHPQVPIHLPPASRGQIPVSGESNGIHEDDRRTRVRRAHSRSPYQSPAYSVEDKKIVDVREGSFESLQRRTGGPQSREHNDVSLVSGDGTSEVEKKKDVTLDEGTSGTPDVDAGTHTELDPKRVEQSAQDLDDREDSYRAARSSENSKARSGNSREYQRRQSENEEEVLQVGRSVPMTSNRRNPDVNGQDYRSRSHELVQEMERNRGVVKGREPSYKDIAMISEGLDRRRERDKYDKASSQWRDDDPQGRGSRAEDTRKRDRTDDVGSRHRSRGRESERSDGLYEVNFDKDLGLRPRERDDSSWSRYESAGDYPNKRRKEEHLRREHVDKEEMIHSNRESKGRQKQERERDDIDDRYPNKHKDDIPMHRERSEKQKNRDVLSKTRQSHDEDVSKRDREVPGSQRSGRGDEDKPRVAHGRSKDEYRVTDKDHQYKDTSRQTEQFKSRDCAIDESKSHHRGHDDVRSRGNQISYEEKRSRPERLTSRSTNFPENQKMHEREHRESTRKNKESEAGAVSSKRKRDDQTDRAAERGLTAADGGEEASSDDEQSDSRRGRSKLERWASHKERDFTINTKSSSSLKMKELGKNSSNGGPKEHHPPRSLDAVAEEREAADVDVKNNNAAADLKPVDDNRLLDTVEKLKKRSERFKLPMPIEKEAAQTVKRTEPEAVPSAKSEAPTDTETKHERPARKRRWVCS